MNSTFNTIRLITLLLAIAPVAGEAVTWYSQGSGIWGDSGTPGLWNTDPGGSGVFYDGTDIPTAGDDVVIQSNHAIQLDNFGAVSNQLEVHTLTVETDAILFGPAAVTMSIYGSFVTVNGSMDCSALVLVSSPTAGFNTVKGTGIATLKTLSFKHSLPVGNVSVDLNLILTDDYYPFDAIGMLTTGSLTVEKGKTLEVQGSVFLDADAANGFSLNQYESDSDLIVDGTLRLSGTLRIGSDNFVNDLLLRVNPGGSLELSGGPIDGGPALWAATSIVDVDGTLVSSFADPIQNMNNLFFVRMNTNSLCRLEGGPNQLLDADVVQGIYYDVAIAGTGPKVLSGDTDVFNDLELGAMLQLGNFDLRLNKVFTGGFFSSGLPVTGYSVDRYIETAGSGQLRMWIPEAGLGASNTILPVGNGNFTPVVLTNSSTTNAYFDIRVENGVHPSGPGTSTNYVDKTWHINPVSSFSSPLNIQFFWNAMDQQNNFNGSLCWATRHDGTEWDQSAAMMADLLGLYGGPQYEVVRTGITAFGTFSIASDGILPVEWLDVSVATIPEGHLLHWRTASELNNSHFEVEYSSNGIDFSQVGKVEGQGTVQEIQDYDWIHRSPSTAAFHYYRLRQVDLDGQFSYSTIVVLEDIGWRQHDEVRLYPNPVTEVVYVRFPAGGSPYRQLQIYSLDGRLIARYPASELSSIALPVSTFRNGTYLVKASAPGRPSVLLGRFQKL